MLTRQLNVDVEHGLFTYTWLNQDDIAHVDIVDLNCAQSY